MGISEVLVTVGIHDYQLGLTLRKTLILSVLDRIESLNQWNAAQENYYQSRPPHSQMALILVRLIPFEFWMKTTFLLHLILLSEWEQQSSLQQRVGSIISFNQRNVADKTF